VLTDYTDTVLLENLQHNVDLNLAYSPGSKVFVKVFFSLTYLSAMLFDEDKGYVWGKPVTHLLELLPDQNAGFDVILMSDLVFNHSQVCILPTHFGQQHILRCL